jgi:RNA polymerase sigma-70 factor, ECF subfamily
MLAKITLVLCLLAQGAFGVHKLRDCGPAFAGEPLKSENVAKNLEKAQLGDETAWATLVSLIGPRLQSILLQWGENKFDADDILQATFIGLLKYLRKGDKVENPSGLIYYILRSARIKFWRKEKRSRIGRPPELGPTQNNNFQDSHSDLPMDFPQVWKTIQENLPDTFYQILMLRHMEGLSNDETAKVLEIPLNTAKSRLVRAKKRAREILRRSNYSPLQ